jgi:hypothetical protein
MNAAKGQSLELFFIDGTPDGMLTAEIFNWTGHVLMTPRTQLAEALRRAEASYTGVYLLLGESEESSLPLVYIGESEDVGERIRNHDTKLDWWTKVILITTSANNLHKAHVKYLESRLVEEARRAGRFKLMNGNTPPRPSLSEAAKSNMERFVEHVLLLLPAIRVDGFLLKIRPQSVNGLGFAHTEGIPSVEFQLRTPRNGVTGTAKLVDGEFVVQPGSVGRTTWEGAPEHNYKKLFDEVVANGVFIPEGTNRVFKEAYAFTSPSAAGAVLNGRPTNGPESWRLASDNTKTYRQWEFEKLANQST